MVLREKVPQAIELLFVRSCDTVYVFALVAVSDFIWKPMKLILANHFKPSIAGQIALKRLYLLKIL
jgi:hypothetical protein